MATNKRLKSDMGWRFRQIITGLPSRAVPQSSSQEFDLCPSTGRDSSRLYFRTPDHPYSAPIRTSDHQRFLVAPSLPAVDQNIPQTRTRTQSLLLARSAV